MIGLSCYKCGDPATEFVRVLNVLYTGKSTDVTVKITHGMVPKPACDLHYYKFKLKEQKGDLEMKEFLLSIGDY